MKIKLLDDSVIMKKTGSTYKGSIKTEYGPVTIEVFSKGNGYVMRVSIEASSRAGKSFVSEKPLELDDALSQAEKFFDIIEANDSVTLEDILGAINSFELIQEN